MKIYNFIEIQMYAKEKEELTINKIDKKAHRDIHFSKSFYDRSAEKRSHV